jgi:hypothetical protein
MSGSFLESTLLLACPSFRPEWDALRRGHAPHSEPAAADFLAALSAHVLDLLVRGHVAEFAQVARTVERLLAEADPILADLLAEGLVAPLAQGARALSVPTALVAPHIGPRTRRAWDAAAS